MEAKCQASVSRELCRHVLVVEDSMIIAMDAEALVNELGAERVTIATGVEDALESLKRIVPTLAILDVKLNSENCFPVADKLSDMKIPYIFATGYSGCDAFPERHRFAPFVSKPFDAESLRRAISCAARVDTLTIESAQPGAGTLGLAGQVCLDDEKRANDNSALLRSVASKFKALQW